MPDLDDLKTPKKDKRSEQERVTEAYENISKKLEDLRSGQDDREEEAEVVKETKEIEETKGEEELGPLDREEDTEPKKVKGQETEEEVDPLDDVDEGEAEVEADADLEAPKETLAQRGEELKEEVEAEEETGDKWSSFKGDPKDENPSSLDDLADQPPSKRFDEEEAAKAEREYQQRIASGAMGNRKAALEDESPNIPRIKPSFAPNMPINEKRGKDPFSDFNPPTTNTLGDSFRPPVKKGASKMHVLFLITLGLGVIGATIFLLQNQFSNPFSSEASPSPSAALVTATPEPTLPPLDRSKYKVRVLNGTTKTGLAASVSAKLKGLGYQDDKTSNATNSAFARTVVRTKSNLTDLVNQLIMDLAPDFDATASTSLKDSDSVDAEVILGTK